MRLHIRTILTNHWIALLLIGIAILLRLWDIDATATFLGDQGRDAIIMRNILLLEHFPAIGPPTSVGQVYMGPFFYYFMAPWLLLFNFNPIGPAIGTALLSIVGLLFFYFILYRFVTKRVAVFSLFFAVFSFTLTEYARFSWNPNLLPYVSFLLVTLFYYFTKKRSSVIALIAGGTAGIALQFHVLSILVIFPLFCFWLYKKEYKGTMLALFTACVVSVPLVVFDLRHNFLNFSNLIKFLTSPGTSTVPFFERILDVAQGYVWALFHVQIPGIGSLVLLIVILAFVFWKIVKQKNIFLLLNWCVVIFFLISFSFIQSGRFPHYFGAIVLPGYMLFSYFLPQRQRCALCYVVLCVGALVYIGINIYSPLFKKNDVSQIIKAQLIAQSINEIAKKGPIQIATIPSTETDEHYRYFVHRDSPELQLLDKYSTDAPNELYVLCFSKKCDPLSDGQWHIAAFSNKTIGTVKEQSGIKIYQLLHGSATIK